jgi:hypothetical protein
MVYLQQDEKIRDGNKHCSPAKLPLKISASQDRESFAISSIAL